MDFVSGQEDQSRMGLLASQYELPTVVSQEWSVSFEEER
jgi:hypothetical protein